jgi:hypothetical protein
MQNIIEITRTNIQQLRSQLSASPITIERMTVDDTSHIYHFCAGGQRYCITYRTIQSLLRQKALPPSLTLALVDQGSIHRSDRDSGIVVWL